MGRLTENTFLKSLFSLDLLRPRAIVVSGPQRSGTTICSKMLAYELFYDSVDEEDYGVEDKDRWQHLLKNVDRAVVHCPAMARWIHEVPRDVGVVWMVRDIAEAVMSAERIGWNPNRELKKYQDVIVSSSHLVDVLLNKELFWRDHQRSRVKHKFEILYPDLAVHPMWIPKDQRTQFKPRQWRKVQ